MLSINDENHHKLYLFLSRIILEFVNLRCFSRDVFLRKFNDSCDKSAKALLITIVEDRAASAIKIWVNYGDKNCNRANEGGDNHRLGLNGHHQIF